MAPCGTFLEPCVGESGLGTFGGGREIGGGVYPGGVGDTGIPSEEDLIMTDSSKGVAQFLCSAPPFVERFCSTKCRAANRAQTAYFNCLAEERPDCSDEKAERDEALRKLRVCMGLEYD